MITAYVYLSCSSCRKATDLLTQEGAEFQVRDFFREKLSRDELTSLLSTTGLLVANVLSTRSTPYREMDLANRDVSEAEVISLMLAEPRLLKRPIIVSGSHAVIGYKANEIRELVRLDRGA